jgi:hypothetical protein
MLTSLILHDSARAVFSASTHLRLGTGREPGIDASSSATRVFEDAAELFLEAEKSFELLEICA